MKSVLVLLASILITSTTLAQSRGYVPPSDSDKFLIFSTVTAGPYFTGGVSAMNEDIPKNWHTDPEFAYRFGGVLDAGLTPWLGIQLGLGYDARGVFFATEHDSVSADLGVQYVTIEPSLRLFWLIVGLAFDIPMSGSATVNINNYSGTTAYTENRNIANSDISSGMELHGGLSIPIYKAESGEVHLLLSGSYPMSKALSGTSSFDTTTNHVFKDVGQGRLPTVQAGISYQFDMLHL
jgi:hypothetical protein